MNLIGTIAIFAERNESNTTTNSEVISRDNGNFLT
jgi:hypothetical protein